jgi:hypothetical protein
MRAIIVNQFFQFIDPTIRFDNAFNAGNLAVGISLDSRGNLGLNQPAHLQDMRPQAIQIFVEATGNVVTIVHVFFLFRRCL